MTKAGAMNLFGIVRCVGLATLVVGLLFLAVAAYLVLAVTIPIPGGRSLILGSAALSVVLVGGGVALTIIGTLTRLFVSWMRFVPE
jgi:hypothetical protein